MTTIKTTAELIAWNKQMALSLSFNDVANAKEFIENHKATAERLTEMEAALKPLAEAMPQRGQHNAVVFDRTTGHRVFRIIYGAVEKARELLGLPEWEDPYEDKSNG